MKAKEVYEKYPEQTFGDINMRANYELAKELKNAGFPQIDHGEDDYVGEGFNQTVSRPTLSELIEACGEEFESLNLLAKKDWEATGLLGESEEQIFTSRYSTPSEAIARLWLALNKKS